MMFVANGRAKKPRQAQFNSANLVADSGLFQPPSTFPLVISPRSASYHLLHKLAQCYSTAVCVREGERRREYRLVPSRPPRLAESAAATRRPRPLAAVSAAACERPTDALVDSGGGEGPSASAVLRCVPPPHPARVCVCARIFIDGNVSCSNRMTSLLGVPFRRL